MASVLFKNGRWYMRVRGMKTPGKWAAYPTDEKTKEDAQRFADETQRLIDRRDAPTLTLRAWCGEWLKKRAQAGLDWKKDRGRLDNHVLPDLGGLALADVTAARIVDLVHHLRFVKKLPNGQPLGNRTVRNIYTTLAACLRDAELAGKITRAPAKLDERQLGPVIDKDPEWRSGALFTRKEAQAMISDHRIPLDRQLVYAFGLLAGLRPGEVAALRWRNYDATKRPLGMITAANAYSTSYSIAKGTKTNAVKFVPVHPVLAQMLAEWRSTSTGGTEPDDLIVPLPPDVKRTKRTGERFRGWDYTGRRWRELDLPALGFRHRSVYDTRATFITLVVEDGASRDIIRDRVTHVPAKRTAFDGYDRGERWAETCREVGKLRLTRLVPAVYPEKSSSGKWLRRRVSKGLSEPPVLTLVQGGRGVVVCSCHPERSSQVQGVYPAKATALR